MDIKLLIEVVIKNDEDGKIINELIEKKLVTKDDVVNYAICSNDFDIIYYVSKYVNNVDVDKLEQKVLEIGSGEQLCKFAANIFGVNVSKFEDKIVDLNNADYICEFAMLMEEKGANFERLENKILEIGNASAICEFARCTMGADLKKLEDKIIEIGNAQYISEFAFSADDADLDRLADEVIKSNEYFWMINLASKSGVPVEKLLDAVINSGDYSSIKLSFHIFGDKYTDKYIDFVSQNENPSFVFEFTRKYNSILDKTSIEKLADAVIKGCIAEDDIYYIKLFVCEIIGCPAKKMLRVIRNYNNGIYKNGYIEIDKPKVKKKLFNRKK